MKICIALAKYPPRFGGHGIQIQQSLPYLEARGISPTVLTIRPQWKAEGAALPEGAAVHRMLVPGKNLVSRLWRIAQFRGYFEKTHVHYDLLHAAWFDWEFMLNIPRLKALGLPLIVEMVLLGGDDPLTISRERWGPIEMKLLRKVDMWVGLARAFMPRLVAAGIPEERFRLIHGGVDVSRFRPFSQEDRRAAREKLGASPEARIVVTAGSVVHRKGMDRVVKAWAKTQPRPGKDLLLIVGPNCTADGLDGSQMRYVREVEELVGAMGTAGTVKFAGLVNNLEDYLGAADVFLFLSRQEGLGYVILEAMASGLPCIVSPLDGIACEMVTEGRTGTIIADPDDTPLVARTLAGLLQDPETRFKMGREGRLAAQQRFSFEVRAKALSQLYREVIDRCRTT